MKDFIVMIAILLLGVVIVTIILGFKSKMAAIGTSGTSALDGVTFDTSTT